MAADAAATPAQLAKGALRRLALAHQEPTPENYARAYAEEAGQPPPADARHAGAVWAALIERVMRGLERGARQWTPARKKESLQRVLDSSASDAQRLQQRLQSLMQAWEADLPVEGESAMAATPATPVARAADGAWPEVTAALQGVVQAALPPADPRAGQLADELARLADKLAQTGPEPATVQALADACERARRLLGHRHRLFDDIGRLCTELSQGLTELSEDASWARGQCESLQASLADGVNSRSVRAATELLHETRLRQQRVQAQRSAASQALKDLIQRLLGELGELGEHTGRFGESVGRHAEAIARADTLESLAGVVRTLVDESHAVQSLVRGTQDRLQQDHARAGALESRVRELEGELRRLSDEVSTDMLTQVANRRGLQQAFEAEVARAGRAEGDAALLAVGLIDIDNFKKLNDSLGHAAGDQALKSLAAGVRDRLRPVDTVARFGGEEFVVLLPATPADEAQLALTRLQRALSASLFMHDGREVLVTFSAGVTAWRPGEALETALERADEALYEAKRTGKNRTCLA
ncbi:MAG: diguanylate cyclase [Rubrivivax sp.]|nr:diguanylate cyclase [Rubrivivax sp.]